MAIITRQAKGSPLTFAELDNNFLEAHKTGTKAVDETNIGDTKILAYDSTSGKLIYVSRGITTVADKTGANGDTVTIDLATDSFIKLSITGDVALTCTNLTPSKSGKLFISQDGTTGHAVTFDSDIFIHNTEDLQPTQNVGSITYYEFVCYSDTQVYISKHDSIAILNDITINSNGDILAVNSSGDTLGV